MDLSSVLTKKWGILIKEESESLDFTDLKIPRDYEYALEEIRMSVGLIFKIAAVGILVTILNQVLKYSGREEQAFLVSLAGLILVLMWIIPSIYELFTTVQDLFLL